MNKNLLYGDLTEKIIGAAFAVHNTLGEGLTEKTYQTALAVRLRGIGFLIEEEKQEQLFFDKTEVGFQRLDLVVEGKIVIETKTVKSISSDYAKKLLSTLRNTPYQLGLIINFGPSVEVKRVINSTQNK
ncbi:MAG: GxxExxY protein [Bacteroidota bacterium]